MKLCNKKGFILVETLIVTAFVMTLFIFIYQNVVPYLGEYEKMVSYDDIDSLYAANQMKNVVLKQAKFDYIDGEIASKNYVNISNCNDTNIYTDTSYCNKMKNALSITEEDYIFITTYGINDFRFIVKTNEMFDSGKLSNFRSYMNTLPNVDTFYDENDLNRKLEGKYRLFITRTVVNSDLSTSLKYANVGIFSKIS